MISREEVRAALTGPFPSLKVPFHRDGDIDYGGLRNVVDRAIAGGAKTALLTWGDSLYSLLTDDEVAEIYLGPSLTQRMRRRFEKPSGGEAE